jgi:hypothetical protein
MVESPLVSDMSTRTNKIHWLHSTAVTVAIIAVVLLATSASLCHLDVPGSGSTCPICHFAHISVFPGLSGAAVSVHLSIAWALPSGPEINDAAPILPASSPRAPPHKFI